MLDYLIPLLACYLQSDLLDFWFWPMVCFGFLYIVPSFLRSLFSWR